MDPRYLTVLVVASCIALAGCGGDARPGADDHTSLPFPVTMQVLSNQWGTSTAPVECRGRRCAIAGTTLAVPIPGPSIKPGYGAWLDHSAFAVGYDRLGVHGYAVSLGDGVTSNPTRSGSATWRGTMAAVNKSTRTGGSFRGTAVLRMDFARTSVDFTLAEITDHVGGARRPDMVWRGLAVSGGRFASAGPDQVQGAFYGSDHSEVGGTFDREGIVGAFGARRD